MKILLDVHTHTIASGHAFSSLQEMVRTAAEKEHRTLLEINNSSLNPVRKKIFARDNNLEILRLCKRYEEPVILGSDAHISFDIAHYDHLWELLRESEFPEALIVNDKIELFKSYL